MQIRMSFGTIRGSGFEQNALMVLVGLILRSFKPFRIAFDTLLSRTGRFRLALDELMILI